MIIHSFDNEIFNVTFSGIVNFDEIIKSIEEFRKIEDLPKELSLLYDLRDADLQFAHNEIKLISQAAENSTKKYTSIKSALLVNDPKITAYTALFSSQSKEKRTQRRIFSTKEAAIKWLLK